MSTGPRADRTFIGPGTFTEGPPPPVEPRMTRYWRQARQKAGEALEWAVCKAGALLERRGAKPTIWPGESDYTYYFDLLARRAQRHGPLLILAALSLLAAFVGYMMLDAFYLHNHGLTIVSVGAPLHERTLAARRALNESDLLTVFRNDIDLRPSRDFPEYPAPESCANIDTLRLIDLARRYLVANQGHERCCCAPMFGIEADFIALYRSDDGEPLYMFNARDYDRPAYDALKPETAVGGLHIVTHSQVALFASAPQPVRVLRRTRMRIDAIRSAGSALHVEVYGTDAFCIDECLDLIRGFSAVQRAAIQKANGINV